METTDESIVEKEVGAFAAEVERIAWSAYDLLRFHILTLDALYQIVAMGGALLFALLVRRSFSQFLTRLGAKQSLGTLVQRLLRTLSAISMPVLWAVGLAIADGVFGQAGLPTALLSLAASLLHAYIIIRIATIFIPSAYWSSVFTWCAWLVAALNAVGLLDPAIEAMRSAGFTVGNAEINLWTIVKGVLLSAAFVWLAYAISEIVQRRLEHAASLNAALRLLIGKSLKIALIVLASVAGLVAVGVDLTAFAVFSGAVGIGVGLGLQRTIANLVAGFSLLADRSLMPGDVVEVETTQGPTYGVVGKMTARYVSVRTRSGAETLVPNEMLIATAVTNWSYSDKSVRRGIPVGIAYGADVDLAIALCLEAAAGTPRVLKAPPPACLLKGFGDNSIDLELRIWIDDPENGVANVASAVMLRIWRSFKEHEVEIPFPQRDLHLRSAVPLEISGVERRAKG